MKIEIETVTKTLELKSVLLGNAGGDPVAILGFFDDEGRPKVVDCHEPGIVAAVVALMDSISASLAAHLVTTKGAVDFDPTDKKAKRIAAVKAVTP